MFSVSICDMASGALGGESVRIIESTSDGTDGCFKLGIVDCKKRAGDEW
jgi:hypothetical protein